MKPPENYRQISTNYYAPGDENTKAASAPADLRIFLLLIILGLILTDVMPGVAAPRNDASDARISQLIHELGANDPKVRRAAADSLLQLGICARPAVLAATHGDDPGITSQAAQILVQMPWFQVSDPSAVQTQLNRYASPDPDTRRAVVAMLADLPNEQGLPALYRLLREEPDDSVRWEIVGQLRAIDDGPELAPYRALSSVGDDPPLLALCGYAFFSTDRAAARRYFLKCARLEFADPGNDMGQFDGVIEALCLIDCAQGNFSEAAKLRRQEVARGGDRDENSTPVALLELLALQARYGPLDGLNNDLAIAKPYESSPKVLYCLSQIALAQGNASEAQRLRKTAFAASHTRFDRYDTAEFLCHQRWDNLAEAELWRILNTPINRRGLPQFRQIEMNARLQLASIEERRGDFQQAAESEERTLRLLGETGSIVQTDALGHLRESSIEDLWAHDHWLYLKAALAKHDEAAVAQHLQRLLDLHPTDDDIAIDVVNALDARGRKTEADAVFKESFTRYQGQLHEDPNNPMLLNDMAWLCARCDRNLKDALAWAGQAVAAQPENAADIDTLAEVNFRLGDAREAVKLERRATQLDPDDSFMKQELARYASAATRP